MARGDIDVREREKLNIALSNVDKIVMHKYISTIDNEIHWKKLENKRDKKL